MVSLYPDGRNAKEREMGVRFQHVPFPCGKFLPFHTVCPHIRNCLLRMPSGSSNSGPVITQGPPSVL